MTSYSSVRRWVCAATIAAVPFLTGASAHAESALRVAMTVGDIPDWTGQPDQGFEGARFVGWNLYDALINWDLSRSDVEATPAPGLATKWYIDPQDNKRWIFELREGVRFHDGCEWNADVAIWNILRVTSDKVPQFNPVHYARLRSRTTNIDRAEVMGPNKIAILTKTVDSQFPYNLASWFMISKCAVEKVNNDYKLYAQQPSGTGPYKFDKVTPRERIEFVKNPDYWDKKRVPKHNRLVLLPMPEATTRAAALLTGQVDFIEAPSPDMLDKLKSAGMTIHTAPYPHDWDYLLNFQKGPFRDIRVRRAANHAVNREELAEMLNGVALPGYATYPPNSAFYGNPVKYGYDPEKAKALLKEAKCDPCSITVAISTAGSGQMQPLPMNELIKSQLEEVGFKVKLEVMDWNSLFDVFLKGWEKNPQFDAVNASLPLIDPVSALLRHYTTAARSPVGFNWGWYDNKQIDRLAEQAQNSFDPAEQAKLFTRIHELANEDAARVFITHDLNPRALSPKLKGFVQAQSWFQDLTPIVVEEGSH